MSATPDSNVANPEQFIADLQRQLAECKAERDEALEQQQAIAEILQVVNSSSGKLASVFDAVLDKALDLCGAAFGNLWVYNGKTFQGVVKRRVPKAFADTIGSAATLRPGAVLWQLANGSNTAQILDAAAPDGPYGDAIIVKLGHARTIAGVALRKDGALLGAITIYRQQVQSFTDKQIALLQNFAAQAVIAIENARLITETREALEQQTATAEVLQVINSSPGDLAPVFDVILEKALHLCGARYGILWEYNGEFFEIAAQRGVPKAFLDTMSGPERPTSPETTRGRLVAGEDVVHITNLGEDPLYQSGDQHRRALVDAAGARIVVVVSLRKDRELLGAFTLYRQEARPFSDKQIALLQNFAAQAVIAIENARLLGELRQRTDEVAELNRGLEARVAEQVEELGRVGRLKRFLAPQLAELIVSHGDEKILESHRREIVVVFCDLRGYTAFTETAEPEEVLDFLRQYHGTLGPLVAEYEGTLDQFSGDGIMVFFNDPLPIPDPAERAVNMAVAMREAAATLMAAWRRRGRALGFGVGIAQGYATLGQIGFSERSGYTAIGTVCNVAARLCAEAKDGQILLSQRVAAGLGGGVGLEESGPITLKGLTQPIVAYNVPLAAGQTALRIIEGGPSGA